MNKIRHPYLWETSGVFALWRYHFGEDACLRAGYDPKRTLILRKKGSLKIAGAVFWHDCILSGKKAAYLYGYCVHPVLQGQGLGTELLEYADAYLREKGYAAAILDPMDKDMVLFYHYFGYELAGTHRSFIVSADKPVNMERLSAEEYHHLRETFLPENGVHFPVEFFKEFPDDTHFYRGEDFICAVDERTYCQCLELLGNENAAGGIAGAVNCPNMTTKMPGIGEEDAMILRFSDDLPEQIYLGFSDD